MTPNKRPLFVVICLIVVILLLGLFYKKSLHSDLLQDEKLIEDTEKESSASDVKFESLDEATDDSTLLDFPYESQDELIVLEGNKILIPSENLSFEVDGSSPMKGSDVRFGPEVFIPESPTDKVYTRPAYVFRVLSKRNFSELQENVGTQNLIQSPMLSTINDLQVATWEMSGLCTYTYFEIFGDTNNIQLFGENCSELDPIKDFTELINTALKITP